jgi:IS605 OrfB family transposase
MKIVKTVKCKIELSKEHFAIFKETLNRFANACNDILKISQENKTTNKVKLQHLCYRTIKERYNLPANLVIRAIARVAVKRKGKKKAQFFKAKSLDLDQRIFSFKERDMTVSIATHAGRLKGLKLSIGNYQLGLLKRQNPVSATLVYNKRKKCFYIHIVLEKPIETPFSPSGNVVGIDRGIYNLASCTNGIRFSGKQVIHKRKQYCKLRQSLQKKGTKSAKRRLKLLSGKERRWMSDQNHIISKRIIESCNSGDVLVLEDLKYIRDRIRLQKKQRLIHHSWAFGQLQFFLEYKATEKGIQIIYVDPKYSSQRCCRCGYIFKANRNGHLFSCKSCGYTIHADINSPFNIRQVYLNTLADGLQSYSPEVTPIMAVTSPAL